MSFLLKFSTLIILFILFLFQQNLFSKNLKKSINSDSTYINLFSKNKKLNLVTIPKAGDILRYKMTAQTLIQDETEYEELPDEDSEKKIIYYYTEEVYTVEKKFVTYKITYDSILVSEISKTNGNTFNMIFNTNIKDTNYYKVDFIQYNSIINESFFIKVTSKGEIEEVYGLEKVYVKMFKAFGDSLTESEKLIIKQDFGNDAIKSVLQQQFQILPEKELSIADLNWDRSYDSELLYFPVKNYLNYKIVDARKESEEIVITISAALYSEILRKTSKKDDIEYKVEKFKSEGKGTIVINLNRGCVLNKETATSIQIFLKIQNDEASMKSKQITEYYMKVELLE